MPLSTLAPTQSNVVFTCDTPPHLKSYNAPTSQIEEVIKSHILQVREAANPNKEQEQDYSYDIFKVFTTKRRKHGDKASKAPELSAPLPATLAPTTTLSTLHSNIQYQYHCDTKDQHLILLCLFTYFYVLRYHLSVNFLAE